MGSDSLCYQNHPFSMELWKQEEDSSSTATKSLSSVVSMDLLTVGLTKIKLQIGLNNKCGVTNWWLYVGGGGLGCDEDALWGGPKRAPVQVRFLASVPFSLTGVDDTGSVDSSFWESENLQSDKPLLFHIVQHAVEWLEGINLQGADQIKFEEAQAHTFAKVTVIDTFVKDLSPFPELMNASASLCADMLVSEVMSWINNGKGATKDFITEVSSGVYSFPLFTPAFCVKLLAILDAFEASSLPKRRPNTMNNYGMVINDIGLKPIMDDLLQRVLAPLSRHCFPSEIFTNSLDHHHSFVVAYKGSELGKGDRGLDMHHDASEVTLNVCLGREGFTASGLRFCGMFGSSGHRQQQYEHSHTIGSAVFHLGRHRHGADNIQNGERINLIMWARSSAFRAAASFQHVPPDGYPKEPEIFEPQRLCLSKANDWDYEAQIKKLVGNQEIEVGKVFAG